jgi:hypothetical protein
MTPEGILRTLKSPDNITEISIADNWIVDLTNNRVGQEGSAILGVGGTKAAIRVRNNFDALPWLQAQVGVCSRPWLETKSMSFW